MDKKNNNQKLRLAALGDIHVTERSKDELKTLFEEISDKADILLLCGDLTDLGLAREAEILAQELTYVRIPVVSVLGNHDFQSNQADDIKTILEHNTNICILENEPFTYGNIGFAGVKGFIGGFDAHALAAFGESEIKQIVHERDNQAYALENQLKAVNSEKKVVLLHYSPIKATVTNEPPEILPFMGATRYEQIIDQYEVSVAFHGHSHLGPAEGKTIKGIPVFNVSYTLLQSISPEHPYMLFEL